MDRAGELLFTGDNLLSRGDAKIALPLLLLLLLLLVETNALDCLELIPLDRRDGCEERYAALWGAERSTARAAPLMENETIFDETILLLAPMKS